VFVLSKLIIGKTGTNIMNMLPSKSNNTRNNTKTDKKKMKAPDINIDDL